jgi:hypothetical protein
MKADTSDRIYGEIKETGERKVIDGILCDVLKIHLPVGDSKSVSDKWAWYTAYRFTAPGWPECTIIGLAAAKRVIRGRTDPAVLNTLRINPYSDTRVPGATQTPPAAERPSVLDTIREDRQKPRQREKSESKTKSQNFERDE